MKRFISIVIGFFRKLFLKLRVVITLQLGKDKDDIHFDKKGEK